MDVTLRTWSCDGILDAAVLLVNELVANAVLHARTPIGVVIRLNGERLRIEVHDGVRRAPVPKHYSSMATTGRGLVLVERLAQDWGVATKKNGKSVWFELDTSSPGGPAGSGGLALGFDDDDHDLPAVGETSASGPSVRIPAENQGRAQLRLLASMGVA